MRVSGCGLLLVGGEAFRWRPWVSGEKEDVTGRLKNAKGQWEVKEGAWGALELVWPKPGMSLHLCGLHNVHATGTVAALSAQSM